MHRIAGIVGGLGPWAHVHLERTILRRFVRTYERRYGTDPTDQDYPGWMLASLPWTPARTDHIRDAARPSPLGDLQDAIDRLRFARADYILIACNTAHYYHQLHDLRRGSPIELVDMVGEAARAARRSAGAAPVGLLATDGTTEGGVYDAHIPSLSLITGQSVGVQADVEEAIARVKAAGDGAIPHVRPLILNAVASLNRAGASAVILGCTELSMGAGDAVVDGVWSTKTHAFNIVDPIEIVADLVVERHLRDR